MLTGIHFLLTYKCILECDHCFVYGGSNARGALTLRQVRQALDQATRIGTVEWIYFEGGEPFLFYPLLLESIKIARNMGFKVGVVTNAYYATSDEDVELWLRPLYELGVLDLSISDDTFHDEDEKNTPARRALNAARRMGIPVSSICIEKPTVETVISGDLRFRGRAAEKLVEGLPTRGWAEFTECPHEDLEDPERVHLDPYGNVHLCQGLSMGNMWETPLSTLVKSYNPDSHPICRPLLKGGPALLAKEYDVEHQDEYVDACHFCYLTRLTLIEKFPQYLTPAQVYGLE
jgi:pyruvate-formate lyase-activating enzyme